MHCFSVLLIDNRICYAWLREGRGNMRHKSYFAGVCVLAVSIAAGGVVYGAEKIEDKVQEMQEAVGTEAVDRTEETDGKGLLGKVEAEGATEEKKPALETGDGEEGLTVISKTDNEEGEVIWENGNEEREATSETGNEKGAAAPGQAFIREEEPAGNYAFRLQPEGDLDDYILLCMPVEDYVVEKGENLWKIGESVLGDGNRWKEIAERNNFSNPDMIWPGQKLDMPDRKYYMQKPFFQRGKGYLSDEGAFRFLQPEGWALATCSLDARLSTFIGKDVTVRVLWGIEDNDMGEDAWNGIWDEVCQNVQSTAETVFGENLENIYFEKYFLESGNEVYHICAAFRNETGLRWTVSAAYRFGEKNLMEFIGIGPTEHSIDMGKLTLYTAASYEEYEEERHMGFGEEKVVYRGMEVWDYPMLHNPFVLAYELVNGKAWHLKREMGEKEDYVIAWEEPVFPAVVQKALQIDGDIKYSDLLQIESVEIIESVGYDYCSINGERFEVDWKDIPDGDALLKDVANCGSLFSLRVQIGDISDYSPLGNLTVLEELEIQAGRTVEDIGFLDNFPYLRKCVLEKAPQQKFVDSLDDKVWERTCREEGLTTFRKEYDGEPGLAFDKVEIPK